MYIPKRKGRCRAVRMAAGTILAAAIIATGSVPLAADGAADVDSLKKQYAVLQQQQQQLQSQINSQSSKLDSVSEQIADLDKQAQLTARQIDLLNSQIAETDAQLAAKAADIAATQKRVDDNYALYKQRMRALYEAGDVSYVEVLLTSSDINQFLSRTETLKAVSVHDNSLINSLKADTQRLKKDQADLQADRDSLEGAQGTLAAKQLTLSNQRARQAQLSEQLKAGITSARQQADAAGQQAQQTDAQINAAIAAEAAARAKQLAAQTPAKTTATPAVSRSKGKPPIDGQSAEGNNPSFSGGSSVSGVALANYATGFADGSHPYLLGSAGPKYYDCSGFTQKVYAWAGIALTHSAAAQAGYGTSVSSLQPGDLVFFDTDGGHSNVTHVGIYVGGGRFVAANTSTGVAVVSLSSSYWKPKYLFARRILG